jgi:hypothetical protein
MAKRASTSRNESDKAKAKRRRKAAKAAEAAAPADTTSSEATAPAPPKAPRRRPAASPAAAPVAPAPAPAPTSASKARRAAPSRPRARIRLYRHGLGDCILVFLPKADGGFFKILIDCGVVLGTPDAVTLMRNVMSDILAATDQEVDVLIATHEHWDHVSGFIQAADLFKQLQVGQVWLAWTEDQTDPLAKKLKQAHDQALAALAAAPQQLAANGDQAGASQVANLIDFFGELGAAAGGNTTKAALDAVRAKADAANVRYFKPDDAVHLEDPAVSLHILGPPRDEKLINRTLSSTETYGFAESFLALNGRADSDDQPVDSPFAPIYVIPNADAKKMKFFAAKYWNSDKEEPDWRGIGDASELALALDNATNNTSLVLAIEFPDGDVLLFVGDAQVGNWESWAQNALLSRVILYKVGHHGSHNATLIDGLQRMQNMKYAFVPVDHDIAVKKRWGNMPLPDLLDHIEEITARNNGVLLRSDQDAANLPPNIKLTPRGPNTTDISYFEIDL